MYTCIHVYTCVYIYIYRERDVGVYIYIYIHIHIYVDMSLSLSIYIYTHTWDSLRGASVSIGTIWRILAWPLRKDDAHKSIIVNNVWGGSTSFRCIVGEPALSRSISGLCGKIRKQEAIDIDQQNTFGFQRGV